MFQSTPAHERATSVEHGAVEHDWFQSTPAHERATRGALPRTHQDHCFNPRPLTSGRRRCRPRWPRPQTFQSTPAHERATKTSLCSSGEPNVSIHARSRAGDRVAPPRLFQGLSFNPRPLTSGRRRTHRRGTRRRGFNPRPLTSGRHRRRYKPCLCKSFNPRPLTSGRPSDGRQDAGALKFQSTPAHERATQRSASQRSNRNVSIHARSRAGDWT